MKKIDFIGGNTRHCLLAMALPMVAAMFLNMMYNLVDSLWIGNLLGETAYAALTNSTPIILILTSVAMGATNGVSVLLSQRPSLPMELPGNWRLSFFIRLWP